MLDLSKLTPEHFDDLIGMQFPLAGSELAFILTAVDRLKSPSPRAQPFSLTLQAPVGARGSQGVYALSHPHLGVIEIFLVPIAPADGFPRFEAVFN